MEDGQEVTQQLGTDAPAGNLDSAHTPEVTEASITPQPITPDAPDDGPLTAANIAERARRARGEKAAAEPKADETPAAPKEGEQTPPADGAPARGPDGKFLPKDPKAAAPKKPGTETPPPGQAPDPAAAGWKPNPKFTALGKEYDIPKHLLDALKTPEQEKELTEVYQKAMGLDHVKMRHQELFTKHEEVSKNFNALVGGVQDIREIYADAIQSGNLLRLDDFFAKMEIPKQVILQYALLSAQYEQADPNQRAVIDQALANQRKAFDLDKQNRGLSQGAATAESQAFAVQMDVALAKPDIAQIAQAYDSQPGRKPGDFREIVRQHGEYTYMVTKGQVLLPPDQAIQQVIQKYGFQAQSMPAPTPQPTPAPTPTPAPAAVAPAPTPPVVPAPHRDVPVLPNVQARAGASPTKNKPKSIEDLRAIQKNMAQAK